MSLPKVIIFHDDHKFQLIEFPGPIDQFLHSYKGTCGMTYDYIETNDFPGVGCHYHVSNGRHIMNYCKCPINPAITRLTGHEGSGPLIVEKQIKSIKTDCTNNDLIYLEYFTCTKNDNILQTKAAKCCYLL